MSLCEYCGINTGAYGVQKRVFNPLGLELQVVVRHLMCVLGTKLWSSGRAVCTLNC